MTTDIKERLRDKAAMMAAVDFVICAKLNRDAADYIEQQQIEIDTLRHGLRLANDARSDLETKLSAQTAVSMTAQELANRIRNGEKWKLAETEQPSPSDARKSFEWWAINNQPWLLERSTDDAQKLLILTAWEVWQAAISAQRQPSLSDEQAWDIYLKAQESVPFEYSSGKEFAIAWTKAILAQRQDSDKDAERYRKAIAYEDNAGLLYCAVMNHCPDKAAIDAEFDAEAIDVAAIANGAPK